MSRYAVQPRILRAGHENLKETNVTGSDNLVIREPRTALRSANGRTCPSPFGLGGRECTQSLRDFVTQLLPDSVAGGDKPRPYGDSRPQQRTLHGFDLHRLLLTNPIDALDVLLREFLDPRLRVLALVFRE